MAAIAFNILAGNNCAILPPARTPKKLVQIKAVIEPKKTALGDLELPPRAIATN
ncbi:hypothetical protein myaer102_40940 [Microcystis viridis NIES-102]|jgi:hypothetical protein|uniref:Uncharacterized protein n=1 Tax=Microcystis viridis NIES-102 TaxID=213615 RepID=A0A3G9K247_MICVR|nr:hypothetical protein myaer102_40940 [Microcystis viridis NIES-102]